jgi:hypothetical protein
MKKLLATIFLIPLLCFGQKQGNIWYFAEYSGLDFTTGVPVPLSNGQIHSISLGPNSEGSSSICDSAGTLLFYASPVNVYNRNDSVMPNGNGLMGGLSSTQGALIIPQPGSNELFYVFTLDEFQNNLVNGLRYSIVDMCLDNGMGDVISTSKNILLLDSTGEKMAATFHSNDTDIWLVARKHFTNEFYSYLITSSGISAPVVSAIGWANPSQGTTNALGQMKISPDGSKIAFGVGNQVPNVIQLFDFNNSTGVISNLIDLPASTNTGTAYGVAFSPDNSKLYIKGCAPTGLYQFDLSSGIPAVIINSLVNITIGPYSGSGLQLANNGKIYVNQDPDIGVINFPNLAGTACNFVGNVIPSNSSYTFPGFIDSFNYKNGIPNCSTGTNEIKSEEEMVLFPNPFLDKLNITIKQNEIVEINLYDVTARKIFNQSVTNSTSINTEQLSKGIYFYEFKNKSGILKNGKVVKE